MSYDTNKKSELPEAKREPLKQKGIRLSLYAIHAINQSDKMRKLFKRKQKSIQPV